MNGGRTTECADCGALASTYDGDERVCLQCGSRKRRVRSDPSVSWIETVCITAIILGAFAAFYWIGRIFNVWQ